MLFLKKEKFWFDAVGTIYWQQTLELHHICFRVGRGSIIGMEIATSFIYFFKFICPLQILMSNKQAQRSSSHFGGLTLNDVTVMQIDLGGSFVWQVH